MSGRVDHTDVRAHLRRLGMTTAIVAAVLVAPMAGCSGDGDRGEVAPATGARTAPGDACGPAAAAGAEGDGPTGSFALCASPAELEPGGTFRSWVEGPGPVTRGLDASLEARREGSWRRVATLVAPLGDDGEPRHARRGEDPVAVLDIAIAGEERLRYALPPVAPGEYRLTATLIVPPEGDREQRSLTAHRELTVVE